MPRDQAIAEITRRLVDYYHPERIYLFGSAARGDCGPDSDLDFCVVLPDEAPESLYRPGVHRAALGSGYGRGRRSLASQRFRRARGPREGIVAGDDRSRGKVAL